MAKSIYQSFTYEVGNISGMVFGVTDETGTVIAASDEGIIGQLDAAIPGFLESEAEDTVIGETTYRKVVSRDKLQFILFLEGTGENVTQLLSMAALHILSLKSFHEEKYDKISFLKNLLLDKVLPGDTGMKSKELHIAGTASRVVFLIKTERTKGVFVHEIIQGLFPNKSRDYVIILDEESVVLIKELKSREDLREMEKTASIIVDTLNTESMVKAFIGVGTVADSISELPRSFKEAQTALQVGSIFEADKSIIYYNHLGLGRLIYQIPETLCRLFLNEVFREGSFEALDGEYMLTIQKFFENNLNVSETSRQMFVHRNTLVYRLDKIQKITGLDLTRFDDAIILKFAILVKRYLDKGEKLV